MSAVVRSEQAVAEARRNVHELLVGLPAPVADEARASLDALVRAVEARCRARVGDEIRAFAEAAGPAQNTDVAKVGYIGGLVVAETIARASEPGLNATIAALVHPHTQETP